MGYTDTKNLIDGISGSGLGTQYRFYAVFTPFVLEKDFYTQGLKSFTENYVLDPYWYTFQDPTRMALASSRVMRVVPPKIDYKVKMKSLGLYQYPIVTGLSTEQFSITFLETEQFSVKTWLSAWTQSIFAKDGTVRPLGGRLLQLTLTYTDGEDRPVSTDSYPRIMPSSLVLPDYDVSGSEVMLTVNFIRVPQFVIPNNGIITDKLNEIY